ncbi:hypothetical protein K491DRAFT_722966 [Lophiostoma macrostomum CBS 122681]|uniref:Uncharacterized protein n=1 Tax=Lophiostoma macrostomum CBS 122681 TaxID=1314788 RepID=A0A6A6SLZ3_9PLEO|nr:hypothetical protein K491DRAFT_722966 [Lophiostoma macrostomum CBS 122681]
MPLYPSIIDKHAATSNAAHNVLSLLAASVAATLELEGKKEATAIERQRKLYDEQIAQYKQELKMLKQTSCTYSEYIAMIQAVDERRAGMIAYEKTLLEYKQ